MPSLDEISVNDVSWDTARQLVHTHFSSASISWRLIRNSWQGEIDEKEFIKLFSFTRLSPRSLVLAANLPVSENISSEMLIGAVQSLGVPLASVVVAINLACTSALMEEPGPLWKKCCHELMTLIEIGYRFGSRVRDIGPAAGMLAGFGVGCGMLVALNENASYLREWLLKSQARASYKMKESLGVELSQISGFMIQHLGFGHEAALGVAFGSGSHSEAKLEMSPQTLALCATCRWIESLRNSRNYPRDIALRSMFPAIAPPALGSGLRNATLEVLYAEVAPVVREGSSWIWHLPKNSYEETEKFLLERAVS